MYLRNPVDVVREPIYVLHKNKDLMYRLLHQKRFAPTVLQLVFHLNRRINCGSFIKACKNCSIVSATILSGTTLNRQLHFLGLCWLCSIVFRQESYRTEYFCIFAYHTHGFSEH